MTTFFNARGEHVYVLASLDAAVIPDAPVITSLDPDEATEGDSGFDVDINGTDFAVNAIASWDGSPRTTVYTSSILVTVTLLTADFAAADSYDITVENPGIGTSNASTFTVNPPVTDTYATWDPATHIAGITLSGGNLTATRDAGAADAWRSVRATLQQGTGKWYWESTINAGNENGLIHGMAKALQSTSNFVGSGAQLVGFGFQDATAFADILKYTAGGSAATSTHTWTTGDVIGFALDLDNGKLWWSKNGTFVGDPVAGTGQAFNDIRGSYFPATSLFYSAGIGVTTNFGATTMAYTAPTGFNQGFFCSEFDSAWADVEVLTGFEANDNVGDIYEDSPNNYSVTTGGGSCGTDNAQFKYGRSSGLTTPGSSAGWELGSGSSSIALSNGDFTLECWVRFNSVTPQQAFFTKYSLADGNRAWWWRLGTGPVMSFGYYTNGNESTLVQFDTSWSPSTNTWYHVAVCRSGSDLRFFVDGTQIGSTHNIGSGTIFTGTAVVNIGAFFANSATSAQQINGWQDECRLSRGSLSARYTANFTPPAAMFPRN